MSTHKNLQGTIDTLTTEMQQKRTTFKLKEDKFKHTTPTKRFKGVQTYNIELRYIEHLIRVTQGKKFNRKPKILCILHKQKKRSNYELNYFNISPKQITTINNYTKLWNVYVLPDFCSCEMSCQQDYHNADNNDLQDVQCATTKKHLSYQDKYRSQ